jgi:basic amino acid/polyamine antiporter, APA family
MGLSLIAGFSAPIAAAALACANYILFLFPALRSSQPSEGALHFGPEQLIASALVAIFSLLNFFGIRRVALLQSTMTVLKVGLLLAFVLGGFWLGRGDWHHFSQVATRWTTNSVRRQFAVSLFWIYVAYSGWNAATYVAEEIEKPERTLGRALALGTAVVTVLYLALNTVFIYATPLESMKRVVAIGALAASRLFGSQAAGLFSALMACALLSTVNAMIIAGPRIYYAMAREGQFMALAGTVHPRWRTPVNSIAIQGICTILLVFTPFPQLVIYIGFTLSLFATMSVASLLLFRRRLGWKRLPVISFAYPLIPSLFVVAGVWMMVEGILQKPLLSMATVLTLAAGGLIYRERTKRQARGEVEAGPMPG